MKYLLSALLSAASLLSAADFFPMSGGNHWILRSPTGAHQEVRVHFTLLSRDDQTFYRITGYRPDGAWVRHDDNGEIQWLNPEDDSIELLTRFDAAKGPYRTKLGACPQNAIVSEKRVLWGDQGKAVPALRIEYQGGCPDNAITEELYLENIGPVRRVVPPVSRPVASDLVEARVGKFTYASQTGAFFDMSIPATVLKSEKGEARTRVRLHLAARNSDPVRLLFSSSQQYDFKLYTTFGELVWQWSSSRTFLPSVTDDMVLDRAWEQEILIEGVRPGTYTLEGSLTNSGPVRYSTAVPVRIE